MAAALAATAATACIAVVGPDAAPLHSPHVSAALLLGAIVAAELGGVRLHFRSQAHEFTLTEIPIVVGVVLSSPIEVVVASALAVAAVRLVRRQAPLKVAYNVALAALDAALAVAITRALVDAGAFGPAAWGAVVVAALAGTVVTGILVSWAIAVTEGTPLRPGLARALLPALAVTGANTAIALAGLAVLMVQPLALVLLAAPVGVLYLGYRGQVHAIEERDRLAVLYGCARGLAEAGGGEAVIDQLLRSSGDGLGARRSELLLSDRAGRVRLHAEIRGQLALLSGAGPTPAALQATLSAGPEAALLRPGATHPLHEWLLAAGTQEAIVAPLIARDGPMGVLVFSGRDGDGHRFTEADRRLATALAAHAAAALRSQQLVESVDELRVEQERLTAEADHDALTGLASRRAFDRALADALAAPAAGSVGLVYVDLDDFKVVNDAHGHAVGDALLRAVGRRLRALLRPGDIAARLGGDEFAVLLAGADAEEAAAVAERVRAALYEPITVRGLRLLVGASIGLGVGHPGTDQPADVLELADASMYAAKRSGKGRVAVLGDRRRVAPA